MAHTNFLLDAPRPFDLPEMLIVAPMVPSAEMVSTQDNHPDS